MKDKEGFLYYLALITELGLVMAGCILVGLGLGLYIDAKLNWSPFGVLACLLLGIIAAFLVAYNMIIRKLK